MKFGRRGFQQLIVSSFIHNLAEVKRILASGLTLAECEANGVLIERGTPDEESQRVCAGGVGSEGAQGRLSCGFWKTTN